MSLEKGPPSPVSERGLRVGLIFALASERLVVFYEHGQWLTEAQGATLAADWLGRSGRSLPAGERKRLSAMSDELARQIAGSLSREAGLYMTHEMREALDPNYHSDAAVALMAECERLLDADSLPPPEAG